MEISEEKFRVLMNLVWEENGRIAPVNDLVVENRAGVKGLKEIKQRLLQKKNNIIVFCTKKNEMKQTCDFFKKLDEIKTHTFGINPDYYFSIIPLNTQNQKNIEKYMFNLTNSETFLGKIKSKIKNFLIELGLSDSLYESYAVVLSYEGADA